jgi:hypothetical protein
MTFRHRYLAIPVVCALLAACDHAHPVQPSALVVGSGRVVTESRPVGAFTALTVSSAIHVAIVQSGTESLAITADDNVLPLVRAEVVEGRLVLGLVSGTSLSTIHGVLCEVSVRSLSDIDASGATQVEISGLDADAVAIRLSGASTVRAAGAVRSLRLDLSGSSRCLADGLRIRAAATNVSGASYALLRVSDTLSADASGLSTIEYYGDPGVTANVSGGSTVRRVGP